VVVGRRKLSSLRHRTPHRTALRRMMRRAALRRAVLPVTPPGGAVVESKTDAEALKDTPFELNQRLAVPPDFRAAYQRRALMVVEFIKVDPDSTRGVEYPQGMRPDEQVDRALDDLRGEYPQIEFFTYDIGRPGDAETSEELDRGEYGTLATQLDIGYTPFVAMLAPRGEGYAIENLFQGYVERASWTRRLSILRPRMSGATPATSRCSSTGSSSPRAGAP
jgi:hypothetical protein